MKEKFQVAKQVGPALGSFANIKDYRTLKKYKSEVAKSEVAKKYESWVVGFSPPVRYADKVIKPEFKYTESEFPRL